MAGGLIGGIVGNLVGGVVSNLASNLFGSLLDIAGKFGGDMVKNAIGNLFTQTVGNAVNRVIDALPMPQFMKDLAKDVVDNVIGDLKDDSVSQSCQCEVDEALAGEAKETEDSLFDTLLQSATENSKDEKDKKGAGSDGKSWLEVLAQGLADVQNKYLDKAMDAQEKMENSDKESKEFIEAQNEFTANMQLFKMASEATATALKSVGEALSSIARKQ